MFHNDYSEREREVKLYIDPLSPELMPDDVREDHQMEVALIIDQNRVELDNLACRYDCFVGSYSGYVSFSPEEIMMLHQKNQGTLDEPRDLGEDSIDQENSGMIAEDHLAESDESLDNEEFGYDYIHEPSYFGINDEPLPKNGGRPNLKNTKGWVEI